MSGTVSSGQEFSWADYLSSLNLPPTAGLGPTVGAALPSEWEASWISKSEQEKLRDIFALMPPMPMMTFQTFQAIAQNFPKILSIENVGAAGGLWQSFGPTEAGITLAASLLWAQGMNKEADLVRLLLTSAEKKPIEQTLSQFVEGAALIPVDAFNMQLLLRQIPVFFAILRTVDPNLVQKAFTIAEQQIVLSLLDKWIESLAKIAEEQKEAAKRKDIQLQQASLQILRSYFAKVMAKEEKLSQPVLSIVIGSLLTSGVAIGAIETVSPFVAAVMGSGNTIPILDGVPTEVQGLMGALSVGLVSAATTWATPVAMALVASSRGGVSERQATYDSAKAFAVTIASFIMNPSLESFIAARLDEAASTGLIDPAQAKLIAAAFKTSLLMCAMAALYKAETGGVTGKEIYGLIKGTVPISEENFLHTLITLVGDALKTLSPEEAEKLLTELVANYDQELQLGDVTEPITSFVDVVRKGDLGPETTISTPA